MTLDTFTLIVVLVGTSGLMAVMYTLAFWGEDVPEAKLGTGMLITQMITWTLYGARANWPDQVWIVVVGNSALTLGWGFATDAACRFQKVRVPTFAHYWFVPVIAVGSWLLFDNLAARVLFYVLVSCVQMSALLAVIFKRRRTQPSRVGDFMALAIAMAGVALLVRSVWSWLYPDQSLVRPSGDTAQTSVLVTSLVAILTISFGFLMQLRDRAEQEFRYLAAHDGLTGALNRRAFIELAEKEFARAKRTGRALAVMMLDLDHFKGVNDTYGHLAGDEVLRLVTRVVTDSLRGHDAFGRYGGEEFLLLAPETDRQSAHSLAQRIRVSLTASAVSAVKFSFPPPTLSIGVAVLDGACPATDLDGFIALADGAMYRAKMAGRDRVVDALEA